MGLVDGASRNGPDSFWREWWAQTAANRVPEFGRLGECVRQETPLVCGILWPTGAFLRFRGSPGVDAAWPENCRELEAWDENFPWQSHFVPNCPICPVRQLRIRPRGTEISESRPILSHSVSLASGGRAMDRLFGNAHGVMVRRASRGLARGGVSVWVGEREIDQCRHQLEIEYLLPQSMKHRSTLDLCSVCGKSIVSLSQINLSRISRKHSLGGRREISYLA